VIVDEVTPALARQMDLPANTGLVVTDIEDGSLAEVSGLQPGDLICGTEPATHPQLQYVSAARRAASFDGSCAPAHQPAGQPALYPHPKRIVGFLTACSSIGTVRSSASGADPACYRLLPRNSKEIEFAQLLWQTDRLGQEL
jgi:hypothetical protein